MARSKKARSETNPKFPCPHCSKPYAKLSFRYHFEIHAVEQLELMDEFQNYVCPYCPTVLRGTSDDPWTPRRRYMHVLRHHREKFAGHDFGASDDPLVKGVESRAKDLLQMFKRKLNRNDQVGDGIQIQEPVVPDSNVFRQEPAVEQEPLLQGPFSQQLSLGPQSGIIMKISVPKPNPTSPSKKAQNGGTKLQRDENQNKTKAPVVVIPNVCEFEGCTTEVFSISEYRRHYKHLHLTFEPNKRKFVCGFCELGSSRHVGMATKPQANRHTIQHTKRLTSHGTMFLEDRIRKVVEQTSTAAAVLVEPETAPVLASQDQGLSPLRHSQQVNMQDPNNVLQAARSSPQPSTSRSVPQYWAPLDDSAASARHGSTPGSTSASAQEDRDDIDQGSSSSEYGGATPVFNREPKGDLDIHQGPSSSVFNHGIPRLERVPKLEISSPPTEVEPDEYLLLLQAGPGSSTSAAEATAEATASNWAAVEDESQSATIQEEQEDQNPLHSPIVPDCSDAVIQGEQEDQHPLHPPVVDAATQATASTSATCTPIAGVNPSGQPQSSQVQVDVDPKLPVRPHVCPFKRCHKRSSFSTKAALAKHKNNRHLTFCKHCKRVFGPASSRYCRKCVGALDPEKWTPELSNCFVCSQACRSERHLKKHLQVRHAGSQDWKCSDCYFILKEAEAIAFYEGHFRTHVYLQERPLRCLHCRHSFKNLEDRQRHVRQVHKELAPASRTEAANVPSTLVPARMLFVAKMLKRRPHFNNLAAKFQRDYD